MEGVNTQVVSCRYIFVFPQKNLGRKGLTNDVKVAPACILWECDEKHVILVTRRECTRHIHSSEITACVLYGIIINVLQLCFHVFSNFG